MLFLSLASLLLLPMGSWSQPVLDASIAKENGIEKLVEVVRATTSTTISQSTSKVVSKVAFSFTSSTSKTTIRQSITTVAVSGSKPSTAVNLVVPKTTSKAASIKPSTTTIPAKTSKAISTTMQVKTSPAKTTTKTAAPSSAVKAIPTGKRGLAYNDATLTQPFGRKANAASQVSWAYNWYLSPCPSYPWTTSCSYNSNLEFIPMLYNSDPTLLKVWPQAVEDAIAKHGSKHLFTFNEPDGCFTGSSCMNLSDAVATYKKHVQPFAGRIALGAPAVTNAGAPHGLDWLSRFMAACGGCRFDFVNVHWYSNKYAGAAYFKSFIADVRKVAKGRPIWVTEFALNDEDPFTPAENQAFLTEVMGWMDRQPDVAAYAYFMDARGSLVQQSGSPAALTDLGRLYDRKWNGTTVGALSRR